MPKLLQWHNKSVAISNVIKLQQIWIILNLAKLKWVAKIQFICTITLNILWVFILKCGYFMSDLDMNVYLKSTIMHVSWLKLCNHIITKKLNCRCKSIVIGLSITFTIINCNNIRPKSLIANTKVLTTFFLICYVIS